MEDSKGLKRGSNSNRDERKLIAKINDKPIYWVSCHWCDNIKMDSFDNDLICTFRNITILNNAMDVYCVKWKCGK